MVCIFCQGSTGLQMLSKRASEELHNHVVKLCSLIVFYFVFCIRIFPWVR